MFAFFLNNICSTDISIEGCSYSNSIDVYPPSKLITKTVSKGSVLCIKGSVLIKSDNQFVATYKISKRGINEEEIIIKTGTKENPFYFGSYSNIQEMKIEAKDPSTDLQVSILGLSSSYPSINNKKSFTVFTTMKSFNKYIVISPLRSLGLFTWTQYPPVFTVNPHSVIKDFSDISDSFGAASYLGLSTLGQQLAEQINVVWKEDTTKQTASNFKNPFGEDVFYILPGDDAFTLEEVSKFTEDNKNIFTEEINEKYAYPDECKEALSIYDYPYHQQLYIPEGEAICADGSFVFASTSKYKVTVYDRSNKNDKGKTYENLFSVGGSQYLSVIKCSDSTVKCIIQLATITEPIHTDSVTNYSFFTTKNEFEFDQKVLYTKDKMVTFGLTAYTPESKKIEGTGSNNFDLFLMNNSEESKKGNISGHTIMAFPDLQKGKYVDESKIHITIKPEKTANAKNPSYFASNIIYEIPPGVKTEEEVKAHSADSDVTFVKESNEDEETKSNGLGGGAIAGIVIGVIAFIVIICVLVWFFVFRKKSSESGSGEKV
ncbi:hypothetical protein TVAG_485870 [Trichomonas vaginalis G3]|uniref:Uncharacterized protein n=1 Tax=Trichomonas vaginalis (strain ATCC PRA-98 / G3) TaxID=412133 RepID=A2EED4_TRIV3|nr:glycoprotein 38 family [Trichomonas vaginalis G3]EAY08940.1 hypothetical protein TVAG_485870 [Trichomonas vaginalis G3]KAI5508611.1 glycoprotein 38 family [Trichomonas vaginalis G3]|eukprot:XP_001321163.1 hypothetical protein [Trichomonas vaginalis G3]